MGNWSQATSTAQQLKNGGRHERYERIIDGEESSLKDCISENPLYQVIFPLTCRFGLRIDEYNAGV